MKTKGLPEKVALLFFSSAKKMIQMILLPEKWILCSY